MLREMRQSRMIGVPANGRAGEWLAAMVLAAERRP
jgi:hypothetical protein